MDAGKLLNDLTEPQKLAVTHRDGPLLIIAGPGSGKTRVITRRVAYLMSQGVPPPQILAITFTNKAAGEMKNRVGSVIGRPLRDFGRLDHPFPTLCTFHSLCLRILKTYGDRVGLVPGFTIYDSGDQTKVLKDAIKTLDMSSTNFSPGTVHGTISRAKNQLVTWQEYESNARDFYTKQVARIYKKYQQLLKERNAVDFDDLLLFTTAAFRDHPDVLEACQERFHYLLIDEYQDTNHAQYILAHLLARKHRNICVVGDPDQSIYAWRGADIQNILDFEKDYPDARVVRLEQNYRSTKTILALASDLIARNQRRKAKALFTENDAGAKAKLVLCQSEYDEADVVVRELQQFHDTHKLNWSDMAVFYRVNALSRVLEKSLFDAGVPYQIARGVEFYNRKEIKDVLAYLRVLVNPSDDVSLSRIVNLPTRGLGDTTVQRLMEWGARSGTNLWGALSRAAEVTDLSPRAVKGAHQFVELIEKLRAIAQDPNVPVQKIMDETVKRSGYEALLKKEDEGDKTGDSPLDNVGALITAAAEYDAGNAEGSLADYLNTVALVSDADHMKGAGGAVTLMTLHSAKGLEFPAVIMIGLEDGCLPHSRARESLLELEEERRLCFVGITRAETHLVLTKAQFRTIRGLRERTASSQFLAELPKDKLEVIDRTKLSFVDNELTQRIEAESQAASAFRTGQLVRHPTFGIGRIRDMSDVGQHTRAVVEFNQVGRKTLILQYARLEPVG